MQKELQQAGEEGFEYIGQTVFQTTFGGKETVIILERNRNDTSTFRYEYKLLATKKTSTMQKELLEGGMQDSNWWASQLVVLLLGETNLSPFSAGG